MVEEFTQRNADVPRKKKATREAACSMRHLAKKMDKSWTPMPKLVEKAGFESLSDVLPGQEIKRMERPQACITGTRTTRRKSWRGQMKNFICRGARHQSSS